jgi:hypothetical protein
MGFSDYGSLEIGWVLLEPHLAQKKDQDWASEKAKLKDLTEV